MPISDTYTKESAVQRKINQAKESAGIDNPEAVKQEIVKQAYQDPELQQAVQREKTSTEKIQEMANYDQELASQQQANMQQATANVTGVQQRAAEQAAYDPTDPASAVRAAENYQSQIDDIYNQPETGLISPFAAEGVAQGVYDQGEAQLSADRFTRGLIQNQLGSEAIQAANIYQSQYEAEQARRLREEQEQQQKELMAYETARDYALREGGEVYNPFTGETEIYTPEKREGEGATYILNQPSATGKTFLEEVTDDQGSFADIIRQNPQLSQDEILTLARANVNKYGQFRESTEELRDMGLGFIADAGLNEEGSDLIGAFSGELTPQQRSQVYSLPGASELIQQGSSQADRDAIAAGIMQAGSVEEYRKQIGMGEGQQDQVNSLQAKIGESTSGERKDIADYRSFLETAMEVKNKIDDFKNRQAATGPVASLLPFVGSENAKQARSDLASFADEIRKGLFGAAVSEAEMKRGNLPGRGKQEARNVRILNSLIERKKKELTNRLRSLGATTEEIDAYMNQVQSPYMTPSQQTSGNYTIEQIE
jgi:hypothetical protein